MGLFLCEYRYETASEKGRGRIVIAGKSQDEAIIKAKMIAGADSRVTDVTTQELAGGFYRLSCVVDETTEQEREREHYNRILAVAPRFVFEVAAKATVVASDKWQAYKKLAALVKQDAPPPGLKRKVVSKEPIDTTSRSEANAQYTVTRIFEGGKAGG